MNTFKDREAAFEAKFAHDEHTLFIARMRRNRFMAVWASALKGETAEEARSYGRQLIHEDVSHPGEVDDDVIVELLQEYLGDLTDEATIRAKLVEFLAEAKVQLVLEGE
ncbi:MAG: DUF1476 domain-containing protein [Marinibacterium sp.]|nr:DUF1476 domain-containing protein [Marinibacterium sp.]